MTEFNGTVENKYLDCDEAENKAGVTDEIHVNKITFGAKKQLELENWKKIMSYIKKWRTLG